MRLKLCIVAGARPNFMKIAPIIDAIKKYNSCKNDNIDHFLVHTGQHYDERMSKLFFDNLGIPAPDIDLEVGSGSHAVQTAEIMKKFENVCLSYRPSHIMVVGDVNSTIACALVASKLDIKIIHVEAGLRSFDRKMPEEINRILTDSISDILFTTEESANVNLLREGISKEKIFFTGNVMIDSLLKHKNKAMKSQILITLGLRQNTSKNPISYALATLHRPSNVDNINTFHNIIQALRDISSYLPIIFPAHPRTLNRIKEFKLENYFHFKDSDNLEQHSNPHHLQNGIFLIKPLGYLDFLNLMSNSALVITDSGGIQEETTILNVPCITIRENTERPVTIKYGTNVLAGTSIEAIVRTSLDALENKEHKNNPPPLWDGKAAERIIEILTR